VELKEERMTIRGKKKKKDGNKGERTKRDK